MTFISQFFSCLTINSEPRENNPPKTTPPPLCSDELGHIYSFLTLCELDIAARVSRAWLRTALYKPRNESVCVDNEPWGWNIEHLDHLMRSPVREHVVALKVESLVKGSINLFPVSGRQLLRLSQQMHRLETLVCWVSATDTSGQMPPGITSLSLSLRGSYQPINDAPSELVRHYCQPLRSLTSLRIFPESWRTDLEYDLGWLANAPCANTLKCFIWDKFGSLNSRQARMLGSLIKCTYLCLGHDIRFFNSNIKLLAEVNQSKSGDVKTKALPSLQELPSLCSTHIDLETATALLHWKDTLTHLCVGRLKCSPGFIGQFQNLTTVRLYWVPEEGRDPNEQNNEVVEALIQCRNIEYLDLGNQYMPNDQIQKLLKHLTKLKVLDAQGISWRSHH